MIKGHKKIFGAEKAEHTVLPGETVFVLSGNASISGNNVCVGQGFTCKKDEGVVLYPNTGERTECLFVSFSLDMPYGTFDFAISPLFNKVSDCFFFEPSEYSGLLAGAIKDILLSFISPAEISGDRTAAYVVKTEEYIKSNLHLPIRVDDIAESLSLSRGYLRNIFYEKKGISPQEYLMQARMDRACELLSGSHMSVSQVAAAVGYSDALGFSRMFKRKIGISPREFRESKGAERDNAISRSDNAINFAKIEPVAPVVPTPAPTPTVKAPKETEKPKNVENVSSVGASAQGELDIMASLTAQIELAASAARKKQEEEEAKKVAPPPFWLL